MLFSTKKNLAESFTNLPSSNAGFITLYNAYIMLETEIAAHKNFTPEDLRQWRSILLRLLDLTSGIRVDRAIGSKLCQHVTACGRRYLNQNLSETKELILKLCEVCKENKLDQDLLSFAQNAPVEKCPAPIACMIFGKIGSGAAGAVSYYKQLCKTLPGQQVVMEHAAAGIEKVLSRAFVEPGYSENNELLCWIAAEFPPSTPWRKAAELILGLWRGSLKIQNSASLEPYYQEFINLKTPMGNQVAFTIACICSKIEAIGSFIAPNGIPMVWAGIYEPVIRAFLTSLSAPYPDLPKKTIAQPLRENYPVALYPFVSLCFASYASRHIQGFNSQNIFKEIQGPWRIWCDQFGHKEVPYQINPDLASYRKMLFSEAVSTTVKEEIAPWVIEYSYFREGVDPALNMLNTFAVNFREAAQKRLDALLGRHKPICSPGGETLNDLICLIRYAVVRKDTSLLEEAQTFPLFKDLNEFEQQFCLLAHRLLSAQFPESQDYAATRKIGIHGLPLVYHLAANKALANNDANEAISLLELGCAKGPAIVGWKELLAQAYVSVGRKNEARGLLEQANHVLSVDASELFGWILFTDVFPTVESLVEIALYPESMRSGNRAQQLEKSLNCLRKDNSLIGLVQAIQASVGQPEMPPASAHYPEFARVWHALRCALTTPDPEIFWRQMDRIKEWNTPSQEAIIKKAAEKFLSTFDAGNPRNRPDLERLLHYQEIKLEDFFEARLIEDITKGTPVKVLKDRYQDLYTTSHFWYALVALYAHLEDRDFTAALQILDFALKDDLCYEAQMCRILCQVRLKQYDKLSLSISQILADNEPVAGKALARFGLQISIINEFSDTKALLQEAVRIGLDLAALPVTFRSLLLRKVLAMLGKTSVSDIAAMVGSIFDPPAMALIRILGSPYQDTLSSLSSLKASGGWGMFIYRKVTWLFLDELKRNTGNTSLISSYVGRVLPFIKNNTLEIPTEELSALENLALSLNGYDQCFPSLQGVLMIQEVEDVAWLSNGLLRNLGYPTDPSAFDSASKKYLAPNEPEHLDRLWLFCGVVSCWIEHLESKKIIAKSCEQLLKWLTAARIAFFGNDNFENWILKKRRVLPEAEQYIEHLKDFLGSAESPDRAIYGWILDLLLDQVDSFFTQNKIPQARRYADVLQQIEDAPYRLLEGYGFADSANRRFSGNLQQKVAGTIEKWIQNKKGSLETSMRPSEEERLHYKHNYRIGLDIIRKILEVFPKNKGVLRLGLFYANAWNEDHKKRYEDVDLKPGGQANKKISEVIIEYSNFLADALVPLCTRGEQHEHEPENQALGKHYFFKALVENQGNPFSTIEQIMQWTPGHSDVFYFYRNQIIEEFNKQRIGKDQAREKLEKLKNLVSSKNEIRQKFIKDLEELKNLS